MKGAKATRRWFEISGIKPADLHAHLESQFDETMTWDNYGTVWEIDHIVPLSYFSSLDMDDDLKVRTAWSLRNLRPLHPSLNRSKSDTLPDPSIIAEVLGQINT